MRRRLASALATGPGLVLHTFWRTRRLLVLAVPVVALGAWLSGLVVPAALLLALCVFTGALLALSVRVAGPLTSFPPVPSDRSGTRSDFSEISWSFDGHGGRVSEAAVRRLRRTAQGRLARLGLAWDDPGDRARAEELVGRRAWAVITHPGGLMPRLRDLEHCVTVLERLPTSVPTTRTGPTT